MGASNSILHELGGSGLPVWLIALVIPVWLFAHYGPKWTEIIRKDRRETKRILSDDRRKNEKHDLEIKEKLLKFEERKRKMDSAKQGDKP